MVRTRNVSREKCVLSDLRVRLSYLTSVSRAHPYERHTVRYSTPVTRASPHPLSTPTQGNTTELLKALLPALIRDPATYEESLSSICAAHNVDPSVVSAVRYAVEQGSPGRPLKRYEYHRIHVSPETLTHHLKSADVGPLDSIFAQSCIL